MEYKRAIFNILVLVLVYIPSLTNGVLRRCFQCRSRGELGSCKDPFISNATQVETQPGIEVIPCASGWCGKILENDNPLKEEYGVATERMCLQRGPSDSEDRCDFTKMKHRTVYLCMCRGDLCNSATRFSGKHTFLGFSLILLTIRLLF